MNQNNLELLKITGNRPWIAAPHLIAMRIDKFWKPYEYLIRISKILAHAITLGGARIIFSAPPRHGKSTIVVLYLVLFFLNLWPRKNILLFTYGEDFAEERVRLVRDTILTNKQHLLIRLASDSRGSDKFNTVEGGGLRGLGIGSGLAGLPCDLMIIDDIFPSWGKSQNERERKKVITWFRDSYMRLQPNASIVVCAARWHREDLQGWLIDNHSDVWTVISYPAVSKGMTIDPLRRPKGKALNPDLYDEKALESIQESVGSQIWESQYMQNPDNDKSDNGAQIVFPDDILKKIGKSSLPPFVEKDYQYAPKAIHFIGFDIGGKRSHTAIIIGQLVEESDPDMSELHLIYIKKFELNCRLRPVIEELDNLSLDPKFGELCPIIIFDSSGAGGDQAGQLIRERGIKPVIPVTIIGTGKGNPSKRTVPKTLLVENLQDFISAGRIKIPQNLSGADLLFSELRGYRSRSSPKGRTVTYRPTGRNGTDDLIDSVAFICWAVSKQWKILYAREAEGLYENSLSVRRPLSNNRESLYSNLGSSISDSFYPKFRILRFK